LIDDVFKHLFDKKENEKWTNISELIEILRRRSLSSQEIEDVVGFLGKYMLDFNKDNKKARLTFWMNNLFEKSM
jgi:hypothetical protein